MKTRHILGAVLAAVLIFGCVSVSADEAQEGYIDYGGSEKIDGNAFAGEGSLTAFIGENFYDGVVENEDDALDAVYSVIEEIGGDDTTVLEIEDITESEESVYYTFRQYAGDMTVYGASVKLITDWDGNVRGLVSSIVPGIKADPAYNWMIDEDEAEAVVKEEVKKEGLKIVNGATEPTLLPDSSDSQLFHYVWVVYTDNNNPDVDQRYLAHYVDSEGNYLYAVPVNEAAKADDKSGTVAALLFENAKSDTWTGTVTWHDGKKKEISVPLMIDEESGMTYLGDAERKIMCADYADYVYNDTLTPIVPKEYKWFNEAVVNYYEFIRVYDFYDSQGWTGPDGRATPSLILMHYVDEDGEPVDNTCYIGMNKGFQVFMMSGTLENGEPLDIMGHEFTHCVSTSAMTMNLYMNDYGAINEGLSDIMGNALEMILDETTEKNGAWEIGEKEGNGKAIRSMSDPHLFTQPEFVWDMYYEPGVNASTILNDNGGVHTNSSLLNMISYYLDEAGMGPEDQFYYWMNVILSITPRTDYYQMSELLPWCMEISGYPEYVDAVKEAVEATGIAEMEFPDEPSDGLGMIVIEFESIEIPEGCGATATFYNYDDGTVFTTWPIGNSSYMAACLSEGNYAVIFELTDLESNESEDYIYSNKGWVEAENLAEILEEQDPAFMGSLNKGDFEVISIE